LQAIGSTLEVLDLSGCHDLTDWGLRAVHKYCNSLEEIDLTQAKNVTGEPLIPLFKDKRKADQIKRLNLSISKVSDVFEHRDEEGQMLRLNAFMTLQHKTALW
jgi:hypothetical protein